MCLVLVIFALSFGTTAPIAVPIRAEIGEFLKLPLSFLEKLQRAPILAFLTGVQHFLQLPARRRVDLRNDPASQFAS